MTPCVISFLVIFVKFNLLYAYINKSSVVVILEMSCQHSAHFIMYICNFNLFPISSLRGVILF